MTKKKNAFVAMKNKNSAQTSRKPLIGVYSRFGALLFLRANE